MEVWPPSHFILVLRFRFSAHRDVAADVSAGCQFQFGIRSTALKLFSSAI